MKMKKTILAVMTLAAVLAADAAATVKFAKTAVSVKESAGYVELTVNKTGKEAAHVHFATVSGTAVPGREYCATNGVLAWAAGNTKAQKIRVRLIPDEYPTYESNKVFSVSLRAFEEDELDDGEEVATVTTSNAVVTVTEVTKKSAGTVTLAGYYDADEEYRLFANAKKPAFTVSKNGDGGIAALSLVRENGSAGAVRVTVTAVSGTAKLGADFTLGDDPDVTNKTLSVEWADGETGEKVVWISTVDDELSPGVYSKSCSLKLSSAKDKTHDKATLSASSVAVTVRDDCVTETVADFNKRVKAEGVSLTASSWYLSEDSTMLYSKPLKAGKKASFSVKCTGPGFFMTVGDSYGDGRFSWKCGKLSGKANDGDGAELVVPSGSSTITFTYEAPDDLDDDEEDMAMIGSMYDEDRPFSWISFADVAPLPRDKAVVPSNRIATLTWEVPELAEDFEGEDELHYRVRLASAKAKLDKADRLFEAIVEEPSAAVPAGLLEPGKTYYWRVDYLCGTDGSSKQTVANGKSVWSFTVAGEGADGVCVVTGADAYGEPVTNGVVSLHQGVKVNWTLGAGEAAAPKLSVASGKLPDGLKLAKNSKTGVWTLSGTPTKAGTFRATLGGTSGKAALGTLDFVFEVKETGLAAGTYAAVLSDDGNLAEMPSRRLAQLSFTATAAGKLSAKVLLGGKTYSFSDTGYVACETSEGFESDSDVSDDEYDDVLTARLANVQKLGGVSCTNELEIVVRDARADSLNALGAAIGSVTLRMCVPNADGKTATTDAEGFGIPFVGTLRRDNSSVPEVAAALAAFEGYYTVALVPERADSPDAPSGNGYLTLTVDAKGKAKVAGKLADGTAVSATVTGGFEGELEDWAGEESARLALPLFSATTKRVFGGELALERMSGDAAGVALADSDGVLVWNNDDASAMYDTAAEEWSGFALALSPMGGWYDKVCNLQAHYIRTALSVDPEGGAGEFAVELENDKPAVEKASGVTLKLTRATGILTGTVQVTDEYTGKTSKANHAGVVLANFQQDTAEGLWSAGHYLMSRKAGKKTVKVSRSFCIAAEGVDPDFAAGDEGEWAGEDIGSVETGDWFE